MIKDSKQRLFEVMGRLDKTFKQKLNEDFEKELPSKTDIDINTEDHIEFSPEEKLQELTAKVDEMYAMLHSNENSEDEHIENYNEKNDEEDLDNLQEWNFDKKKNEDSETSDDEKNEHKNKKDSISEIAKVSK